MTTAALKPEEVTPSGFDPTSPLVASGNLRRRKIVNGIFESSARAAAYLAVAVLVIVVFSVAQHGASALSLDFITKNPPQFGGNSGGIAPAIVGTAILVAMATAIALPLGVAIALFLTEFASPRVARPVQLCLDLINGMPSIVIGLFVFGLLISGGHHQTAIAGSIALSIIMLPLIARGTQEVLLLVPNSLREAAAALGVSRRRSVIGVILPAAMGGILTSTILAIARAAGETAPLILLTSIFNNDLHVNPFQPVSNIPTMIFQLSEAADPSGIARAWGAGLVLLSFILFTSLIGRALLTRSRKKLTQ